MDSLLATYASSDEEDDHPKPQPQPQPPPPSKPSLSLFSSLPKPQSSSSSSSTPPQIQQPQLQDPSKPSALFSLLPPPKSHPTPEIPLPTPNPKRVVQFRPPLPTPPSNFVEDDEEDEEDEEERERKKQRQLGQDVSVKSFLSSMPTPKNSGHSSLGAAPPSLGSGRRSIIDTEGLTSVPTSSEVVGVNGEVGFGSNLVGEANNYSYEVGDQGQEYASYGGYDASYGSVSGYGGYDSSNWYNGVEGGSTTALGGGVGSFASLGGGKRRKDQPPAEIIEVKQDELMKNRPTEDKSKLTGIAFGPAYQPASTKGKPTKQHKRKHQIGSLYFDMKQKEMELAERRSKGFLTKAETQAKYGW